MKKKNFKVYVIGYNITTFMESYSKYIKRWRNALYDDLVFDLEAPQNIYDEIAGLKEEFIEII